MQLRQFKHPVVQLIVFAFHFQQFFVGSPFNDFSMFQYHNGVGISYRGQAVGDHKYGSSFHQLVHSFFNQGFCSGVNRGCSFIQDQHRRIGNGSPGNGKKLPLSLREISSVSGNHGVISLRQTTDKGVCIGNPGSF